MLDERKPDSRKICFTKLCFQNDTRVYRHSKNDRNVGIKLMIGEEGSVSTLFDL